MVQERLMLQQNFSIVKVSLYLCLERLAQVILEVPSTLVFFDSLMTSVQQVSNRMLSYPKLSQCVALKQHTLPRFSVLAHHRNRLCILLCGNPSWYIWAVKSIPMKSVYNNQSYTVMLIVII